MGTGESAQRIAVIARVVFGVRAQPLAVVELLGVRPEGKFFYEPRGLLLSAERLPQRRHCRAEIHLEILFIAAPRDDRARELVAVFAQIALRQEGPVREPEQNTGQIGVLVFEKVGDRPLVADGIGEHIPFAPAERLPVRAAVPAVIVRHDDEPAFVEKARERVVTGGMLRHAVYDLHHPARAFDVLPRPHENFLAVKTHKFHICPFPADRRNAAVAALLLYHAAAQSSSPVFPSFANSLPV